MTRVPGPALVVVDAQRGFADAAFWGPRNNPACEDNIRRLVAHWDAQDWPLVFVQHDSANPRSPLHPDNPGHELIELGATPDLVIRKSVNSSFYGSPDLHAWLRAEDISGIVVCGITTNHCCETTARMAGNLGYDTTFVIDATHTFDRVATDGTVFPADTIAAVTAANLDGEFARVVTTSDLLSGHEAA